MHKSTDGKLAVVAVLFNQGADPPLLQKLWDNLPEKLARKPLRRGSPSIW